VQTKLFIPLIFILFPSLFFAQNTNDTASYPYWTTMMQDRSINLNATKRAFEIYWAGRKVEKGSGYKAYKRWEWMAEKTVDSLGNFPDYVKQLNQLDYMIEQDAKRMQTLGLGLGGGSVSCKTRGNWKEFGPVKLPTNNTGQMNGMGRLNAVALHPTDSNIIFVGACAGGIWKTTDGGKNWTIYSDSLPTLGVSSIAFDPNTPNTMYMGTGDRDGGDAAGFGVFKTTNGGNSWTQSNTGMGNRIVGKLIVSPSNTSIILAATNNGIYRSSNAGANWTQVITGNFKDIIFKPNNHNIVYATRDGILFRSTNNGVNWTSITSGLPTSGMSRGVIDVSAKMPDLVYFWLANGSVNQGFYLSRDSGTTFRTQSTTPNLHDWATNGSGSGGQAWFNKDLTVDLENPAIVYSAGVNVFRSNDTGKTWTIAGHWVSVIHADQHEIIGCPLTNKIYAANDGGLYFSRNKGVTWIPIKSGLAIAQIYKMDCSRTKKDILINGYQDNGTGNFNNGWFTTRGGDGMDCEIDQTDNRYSYGELYYGSVFRIFNVNTQATIAANGVNGINEAGGWVTPITLRESFGSTMYIGYKNIWRSSNIRNSPPTWTKISNNLGGTNASNFTEIESNIANSDVLYASRSNGTFFISEDVNAATPTWNTIVQPVAGVINAIETDPKNQNVVYIGVGARVYRSINKGTNWTQVATNLTHNVNCILLDTSSSKRGIYVGTNGGGIWYADTTINVWKFYSSGMPHSVRVTDIEMYYDPSTQCKKHILYASTYNRGNWFGSVMPDGNYKPIAEITQFDSMICIQNVINFTGEACNLPGVYKWNASPKNYTFVNGSDSFTQNPSIKFNQKGIFKINFMAENCVGIDTSSIIIRVGDSIKSPNCIPSTTFNVSGLGIFKTEFNGTPNISNDRRADGGFVDYACNKIFRVKRGKKYLLKVTTGTINNEQVKAFIDFNNNADMTDSGELVFQPAAALINHSDSIFIPLSATINKILRFRIRSDFNAIGTNPCSNLSYGQTEDYGIIVEDSIWPAFVVNKKNACENEKIVFKDSTETTGFLYNWDFGTDANPQIISGIGPHSVSFSNPGHKNIKLTIDGFEKKIDSFVLIHAVPNLSLSFYNGDSSLCLNESFSLKALESNSANASYQWYFKNNKINDSIELSLLKNLVSLNDSGKYELIAKNIFCADTISQEILVHPKPTVNFSINNNAQCLKGNQFSFINQSTILHGSLSHRWSFGDSGISNIQNPSIKTYSIFAQHSVKLISESAFSCMDSISKNIQIFENAVPNFTLNKDTQCFNENLFSINNISSISSGTIGYLWNFGDGTTSLLKDPLAKKYNTFNYNYSIKLVVNTSNNCKDSVIKMILLNPSPMSDFNINDSTQCLKGNQFLFTNNSSISTGTLQHEWNFGDNNTSVNTSPSNNYINFGKYKVELINTSNKLCKDTAIKSNFIFEMPQAFFTINKDSQCFKAQNFKFVSKTKITTGTVTNQWNLGDNSMSNLDSLLKKYATEGAINIKLVTKTNNNCIDSLIKTINIFPNPKSGFSINNFEQCLKNNQFTFTNQTAITNGTLKYNWTLGDGKIDNTQDVNHQYNSDGNFNVRLISSSNFNCKDTTTKPIIVNFSPSTKFTIDDTAQCFDINDFKLTDNSNGGSTFSREWWVLPNNNIGNSKVLNHSLTNAGKAQFMLKTITNKGCRDSLTREVIVLNNPVFNINGKSKYCQNDTITLIATSLDNTLVYKWKMGNSPFLNGNPFTTVSNQIGSKNIIITATDNNNCITTQTFNNRVNIYGNPVPAIDTNVFALTLGINIEFIDITNIPKNASSWSSTPFNGNSNNNKYVVNLTDSSHLTVSLSVTDTNNCTGITSKRYFFSIPNKYFFPTAFSPNSDGHNENFGIVGYNKVKKFSMKIFNRWGELIYQTNNPSDGWDGKNKGELVPQGDYLYDIAIVSIDGKIHYKKGMLTILR